MYMMRAATRGKCNENMKKCDCSMILYDFVSIRDDRPGWLQIRLVTFCDTVALEIF